MALGLPLALLLSAIAAPVVQGATSSIFGGSKQSTPFKGWMSPGLGMLDAYLLPAMLGQGRKYGIGDSGMFNDIMGKMSEEWPQILKQYGESPPKGHRQPSSRV